MVRKIILKRLQSLALQNSWISKKQFGFAPGKSCGDDLVNIVKKIEKGFNESKYVLIIFLDISGAFDSCWHTSILDSLIKKGREKG